MLAGSVYDSSCDASIQNIAKQNGIKNNTQMVKRIMFDFIPSIFMQDSGCKLQILVFAPLTRSNCFCRVFTGERYSFKIKYRFQVFVPKRQILPCAVMRIIRSALTCLSVLLTHAPFGFRAHSKPKSVSALPLKSSLPDPYLSKGENAEMLI